MTDNLKLNEIGEKKLVCELTSIMNPDPRLISGFGSDSAAIQTDSDDDLILVNTDRSGMNIAYQMGLADGRCVGDFGVSHAVSDIYASGGIPFAVTIALLLPDNLTVKFVKEIMIGAEQAARRYGAFIAGGDTKKNPKFAMVVTALGKCKRKNLLTRNQVQEGDYLVVTGNLGIMQTGIMVINNKIKTEYRELELLKRAIIFQNPPYDLPREIYDNDIIHGCMDNSDGLISSLYTLSEQNNLGITIIEKDIPCLEITKRVAKDLKINTFQLCIGSGDWQHIFAVNKDRITDFIKISNRSNKKFTVIGRFTKDINIAMKTKEGKFILNRLENDRFKISGSDWFNLLSRKSDYLGRQINGINND